MHSPTPEQLEIPHAASVVLRCDGMYLDEQRWDDWLDLYSEQCEFWLPTWKTFENLTDNPRRELSHIYLGNRAAIEERVSRLRSRRSAASWPMPRTAHMLSNTLNVGASGARLHLRSSWSCSIFLPRDGQSHVYFGRVDHELELSGGRYTIAAKKVIILNDHVPASLDFYFV